MNKSLDQKPNTLPILEAKAKPKIKTKTKANFFQKTRSEPKLAYMSQSISMSKKSVYSLRKDKFIKPKIVDFN